AELRGLPGLAGEPRQIAVGEAHHVELVGVGEAEEIEPATEEDAAVAVSGLEDAAAQQHADDVIGGGFRRVDSNGDLVGTEWTLRLVQMVEDLEGAVDAAGAAGRLGAGALPGGRHQNFAFFRNSARRFDCGLRKTASGAPCSSILPWFMK